MAPLIRYAPETIGVHLPVPPAEGGEPLEQKVCALGSSHGTGDRLLAVGDLFQQRRLHRYPCLQPPSTAERNDDEGRGHASALSSVRFSYNDRYILSAGGEDLAIFVWRVRVRGGGSAGAVAAARAAAARTSRMAVTATTAPSAETGATAEGAVAGVGVGSGVSVVSASWAAAAEDDVFEEEGEEDDEDDSDVEPDERLAMKLKMKGGQMGGAVTGAGEGGEGGGDDDDDDDDDEVFVAAEAMGGEQILSIQPWRAAAVAPSRAPSDLELVVSSQPPDATLELEWVYGNGL